MKFKKLPQDGFHVVEITIVLVVLCVIGFVGFKVLDKNKPETTNNTQSVPETQPSEAQTVSAGEFVQWQFNDTVWQPASTAPACENPLTLGSPIDVTKATGVLYPGQIRGGDFKPHGGLSLDGAPTGKIDVLAMRDSYLFRGSRYIEDGEVQYILDFMDSCGIFYRYDHIAALSADIMKVIDTLPAAQVDDSRTHNVANPVLFKKGTVVATEIGHAKTKNFGLDVGAFDLRQPNAASKTALYQTDALRIADKEQSFYAVCWWDLLPNNDKDFVKALPPRSNNREGATSDYCDVN